MIARHQWQLDHRHKLRVMAVQTCSQVLAFNRKLNFQSNFWWQIQKKRRVYSSAIQCQLCLSAYVRCDFFSQATKISGAGGGGQYNWMMRYLSGILLNLFLPFISFFFLLQFLESFPLFFDDSVLLSPLFTHFQLTKLWDTKHKISTVT